jgi:hypothetical protein
MLQKCVFTELTGKILDIPLLLDTGFLSTQHLKCRSHGLISLLNNSQEQGCFEYSVISVLPFLNRGLLECYTYKLCMRKSKEAC